jgi:hypothetical protein
VKFLLAAVFVSALVFSFGIFRAGAQDVGAYSKAETDDSEVATAANFAMKAREKTLRKTDKDATVALLEILSASKQVVAGVNYKMLLKVSVNYKDQIVEIVVWKKLSDDYELSSWNHMPAKKKESGDSP